MAASVQTRAFVLRSVAYGEADLIVTLLGRDVGKFSAIARRARSSSKRFGGSLLPMRGLDATVVFHANRDLARLDDATVVEDFRDIETTFEKITVASYGTELVRWVTRDGDDARAVFDLLRGFYESVAGCDPDLIVLETLLHHFELSLLDASGGAPSLHGCHRCGAEVESMDKLRCSRDGEGLVCRSCLVERERYGVLAAETLAVLHYLSEPGGAPPAAITDPEVRLQVRRVIDASFSVFIDGELKSRPMLDSIFQSGIPQVSA